MALPDMGIMFLFLEVLVDRKFSGDKLMTIFDVGEENRHQNPQNCRQHPSTKSIFQSEFTFEFRSTEKWTLDDEGFTGEKLGPNLDHYAFYPEIFVVPSDFCATNK